MSSELVKQLINRIIELETKISSSSPDFVCSVFDGVFIPNVADRKTLHSLKRKHIVDLYDPLHPSDGWHDMRAAKKRNTSPKREAVCDADENVTPKPSKPNCTICLLPFGKKLEYKTPCNHSFHQSCMNTWLLKASSFSCPLCRERVIPPLSLVPKMSEDKKREYENIMQEEEDLARAIAASEEDETRLEPYKVIPLPYKIEYKCLYQKLNDKMVYDYSFESEVYCASESEILDLVSREVFLKRGFIPPDNPKFSIVHLSSKIKFVKICSTN